ncbi:phytoene/squalene synthase family protein [Actinocatenispora comari]|uniref:Phytoene synthase n=1 Tax=Actinocatenispora comari TaxID=2807577 RepID=A0A8J4AKD5_9ACTN|nr:phytoene/squalene synthase family protein [Actinocatenispora comari]GIL30947.1 phytoene synthase [Actinocatenispora comari]
MSLLASYEYCRALHRQHGRSYYLATRLLPAWKRRHVHALYGFTRYTDDIVDRIDTGCDGDAQYRARRLDAWSARFRAGLAGEGTGTDPILPAVLHTIAVFGLPLADFDAFLTSMRMDLTKRRYSDYPALLEYMEGSAAVIGTMMLPILLAEDRRRGPAAERLAAAREPARQLGLGFQLTNFIRDVAEDLQRDRVYLPQRDLDRFGVSRTDLAAGSANAAVRELVAFEIGRARDHYRAAEPGIELLPPVSRRCIRLAATVYGGILVEIERHGYDVLSRRAVVPRRRRLAAVVQQLGHPA